MDKVRAFGKRGAAALAEKLGYMEGEEKFYGVRMVGASVDRDLRQELDEFVSDLRSHNCYLLVFLFWLQRE